MFLKPLLGQNRKVGSVGGGGVYEVIGTEIASASSAITFTWAKTFRKVEVVLSNIIPATNGAQLWLRTSSDGGSTYDSGAGNYEYIFTVLSTAAGGTTSAADTEIILTGTGATSGMGSNTDENLSMNVNIMNPSEAKNTNVQTWGGYKRADAGRFNIMVWAQRLSAADVDGVQFLMDSGNIASGEFKAYGMI
jgi:hypothetical protein